MPEEANYCTIYLVRHGESEGNVRGVVQGHLDLPLTDNGRAQIVGLRDVLKGVHFNAAYSSDLLRAKETAEILSKEKDLVVRTSELIRERNYGLLEGTSHEEYDEKVKEARDKLESLIAELKEVTTHHDLLGVENNKNFMARVTQFLRETAVTHPNETILVVGHGGLLATFLLHIGYAAKGDLEPGAVKNGAYVKFFCDGTDFIVKETSNILFASKMK
jgi:probable phosphoglycerate mutase